jgi:hypothetical protein
MKLIIKDLIVFVMMVLTIVVLSAVITGCSTQKHGYVYKTGSTCRNPHKRAEVHGYLKIR